MDDNLFRIFLRLRRDVTMNLKNSKPNILFGSVAQPGLAFGYGTIGEEILKGFSELDVNVVGQGVFDWDLAIVLGLPSSWIIGKGNRPDLLWHTMLEVDPLPPGWADIINRSAGLWSPSNWVKELFINNGVKQPIIVSGYGVDTDIFKPVERIERDEPFKVIAWARSFVSRKSIMDTIRAFIDADLPDAFLEIKLNEDDILAPNGVEDHPEIYFIKETWPKAKLARWLQSADAFVYLSEGEGFGLMPLEAMATGVPTICAYNTGMKDYLTDDIAYLVESKDRILSSTYTKHFGYNCYGYKSNLDQAVELLREVYYNRKDAYNKGKRASDSVQSMTWEKQMQKAFRQIQQTFLN